VFCFFIRGMASSTAWSCFERCQRANLMSHISRLGSGGPGGMRVRLTSRRGGVEVEDCVELKQ